MLNAWSAGAVKRAYLGALGYVMATRDPIRVAEETAILDHMTNGRFFVGLTRGYQARWTNILGQSIDAVATLSDGSADDAARNREIFEERTLMLMQCWMQESVDPSSRITRFPIPMRPACAVIRHGRAPRPRALQAKSDPTEASSA